VFLVAETYRAVALHRPSPGLTIPTVSYTMGTKIAV
jgi:hypothetical protein